MAGRHVHPRGMPVSPHRLRAPGRADPPRGAGPIPPWGARSFALGPALEVCNLAGLVLGLLLGARELVLRLALALLLAAFTPQRRIVGQIARCLLRSAS